MIKSMFWILVFAFTHTSKLLPKLKEDYYHAWHVENRGGLHASLI
jgi:hypothetical protein